MIMRWWRGAVRHADAESYLEHQATTGIADYRATAGNQGALVLTRDTGPLLEVVTVSFWDDLDAVRGFAGDPVEQAKFYPGDDDLLAEKDLQVQHYTVLSADLPGDLRP
jgi:heme-degrading monooxygenase HmoA